MVMATAYRLVLRCQTPHASTTLVDYCACPLFCRPGSIVRSHFCPGVRSEYQGYLAWRGLVPEAEVPAHVLAFLGTKFTVFQGPKFHILAYLIPGEGGQIQAGERRVNWVW